MTQLIGVFTSCDTVLRDDYPNGLKYPREAIRKEVKVLVPRYRDDCSVHSWQTPYWPGTGGLSTDAGGICGDLLNGFWYEQPDIVSGHAFRYAFVGVTRDQFGGPLGGVTMKLFRTVDDTLQDTQVSDASGGYILSTPFIDAHYVVSQKAGPPPVAGATVNTLIPST